MARNVARPVPSNPERGPMTPFLRISASPPDPPFGAIRGPWLAPTHPGRTRFPADPAKQAQFGLNNGLAEPSRRKMIEIHPFIRRILMKAAAKVYDAVLFEIPPEIRHRTADRNLTSIEESLAVFASRHDPRQAAAPG
jgi:hypothetical protein